MAMVASRRARSCSRSTPRIDRYSCVTSASTCSPGTRSASRVVARIRTWGAARSNALAKSAHAPTGFTGGFNTKPVYLPAHALKFKEGVSYSLLLSHPVLGANPFALIQPSAGFIAGQNDAIKVNTVLLGTGGLGKLSDQYIADYWHEMVVTTQAKTAYLIHWDDFTQPLLAQGKPVALKPMPTLLDDFPRAFELLKMFSERDGVTLHVLDAWQIVHF